MMDTHPIKEFEAVAMRRRQKLEKLSDEIHQELYNKVDQLLYVLAIKDWNDEWGYQAVQWESEIYGGQCELKIDGQFAENQYFFCFEGPNESHEMVVDIKDGRISQYTFKSPFECAQFLVNIYKEFPYGEVMKRLSQQESNGFEEYDYWLNQLRGLPAMEEVKE